MSVPKVSIVVPIYNVEKYLERCINGLINQTLKDIEIILVDDESPDNCPKMCEEYVKKDSRIKVIHKQNQGLGMARNSGIEASIGKYISFIDSDDKVDIDFFEKLFKSAEKYNTDITIGGMKIVNTNNEVTKEIKTGIKKEFYEKEEINSKILKGMFNDKEEKIPISANIAIYKKEIFEKNNIKFYSERQVLSEDILYQLDIIPCCNRASIVADAFYYYCSDNEESLTRKYMPNKLQRIKNYHEEVCKKLKEKNIYDLLIKGEIHILNGKIRECIKQERKNEKDTAIKNIYKICSDQMVQNVVRTKIGRTKKQLIFDTLIKYKMVNIIYRIIK